MSLSRYLFRCNCKPTHQPRRSFSTTPRRRAEEVRIVEVGPRDGLQNEKTTVPLSTKLELIRRLAQTGIRDIEAGSFVAPKWVPQMANSSDILKQMLGHPPQAPHSIAYSFLVPNARGLENFFQASEATKPGKWGAPPTPLASPQPEEADEPAPITSTEDPNEMPSSTSGVGDPPSKLDAEEPAPITSTKDPNDMPSNASGVSSPSFTTEISLFAAATESFSKANTNCTIQESLDRFKPIIASAKERNLRVRGYISVALGCPYEGPNTNPHAVAEITANLLSMGVDEVSVADTTGMGTAPRTKELLKTLSSAGIENRDIALHFHDTYGQALVNTVVGLEHGIRTFDSSVGGLGGCPYSKGATGNVATEDLVYCLESLGLRTDVNLESMARVGAWISGELGRGNEGRAGKAVLARLASG